MKLSKVWVDFDVDLDDDAFVRTGVTFLLKLRVLREDVVDCHVMYWCSWVIHTLSTLFVKRSHLLDVFVDDLYVWKHNMVTWDTVLQKLRFHR